MATTILCLGVYNSFGSQATQDTGEKSIWYFHKKHDLLYEDPIINDFPCPNRIDAMVCQTPSRELNTTLHFFIDSLALILVFNIIGVHMLSKFSSTI